MSTLHETDGFRGREHVLAAYWTVTICDSLDAPMIRLLGDSNASTTPLAVKEILANAPPDPANTAVIAVIDILIWVIIPQLADAAIIPGSGSPASHTYLACALGGSAEHA